MNSSLKKAIDIGVFDSEWYSQLRGRQFKSAEDAFNDYARIGVFSDVPPSANFDGVQYLQHNFDVYLHQMNPMIHYVSYGKEEGRYAGAPKKEWLPQSSIDVSTPPIRHEVDLAIVLHIYYEDYVERYAKILSEYFIDFTLYITTPFVNVVKKAEITFGKCGRAKAVKIKKVPNKGRNFGPFLVEFADDILKHEYMIHLHSKKSLHSGREQNHWANYLTEYLLADQIHIAKVIDIFEKHKDYGLFYPKSFWNMPSWVNHWLKNKGRGVNYLREKVGIESHSDFFAYPVGGMFMCRVKALEKLLRQRWTHDDWPDEPLPADGTVLHVLERVLPFYAEEAGFKQFFFDARTGSYTEDDSFIFSYYLNDSYEKLKATISTKPVISFDIFDTLLCRDSHQPDLHKKSVPAKLGLKIDGDAYHELRDRSETELRRRNGWSGDVDILEICEEVAKILADDVDAHMLAEAEFDLDFARIQPKPEMVEMLNSCLQEDKKVLIVSDTYYNESQIRKILKHIGVLPGYELFVSSNLKRRKDRGDLWDYIAKEVLTERLKLTDLTGQFLHIGDNVCADAQNVGDRRMGFFHILNPIDKWQAMQTYKKQSKRSVDADYWRYWGPLVTAQGRNPFL